VLFVAPSLQGSANTYQWHVRISGCVDGVLFPSRPGFAVWPGFHNSILQCTACRPALLPVLNTTQVACRLVSTCLDQLGDVHLFQRMLSQLWALVAVEGVHWWHGVLGVCVKAAS